MSNAHNIFALFVLLNIIHSVFSYSTSIRSPTVAARLQVPLRVSSVDSSTDNSKGLSFPPWLPTFGTAATGGLLFGYDIGSSSSVVRILGQGTSEFGQMDPFLLGQVASGSLLGAMCASALLIFLGDSKIGRKIELLTASALFSLGTAVQSFGVGLPIILFGRVIYGLGIGTAMHVAPLYIAETSPNNLRGKLVSLKEAAIVGGIVLGYAAGAVFGNEGGWRNVFECAIPMEILMILGALYVPESPRWLALRGRPEEAVAALQKAQGLSNAEAESQVIEMTKMTMMNAAAASPTSSSTSIKNNKIDSNVIATSEASDVVSKMKEIFTSPYNRQALIIGIGLVLFQQLSGQPSVLYFANRIFESAGLGFEAALGVGVFKLVMTLVSAALVEDPKWGRRQLLLYGNAGITASLVALSVLYGTAGVDGPNQAAIIAAILVFVGCYQIGFGPITWLILSEIFPLRIRSGAVSIGTLANFGSNLLIALVFEAERVSVGESLLFAQFAGVALVATLFTYKYVFETRGLSLEEIESKLKDLVDNDGKASS
eukprot:gene11154-23314_t